MSKPSSSKNTKSKRPDGKRRPKTRQQQQQEVNVYMYRRLDAMEKLLTSLLQKMELVSALTQQMITTMVILNEKGLITNVEIAEKQRQLMLPVDEQLTKLADQVEGRAGTTGEGEGETVGSNTKETVDVDATDSDSNTGEGVSEPGEVQSEATRTAEGDVGLQDVGLSDRESKGSDKSSDDREITKQSNVSTRVSIPTDPGHKTPHLKLD